MQTINFNNAKMNDASGTITTGGVSQLVIPANPEIRGYKIYNSSANDLWVNDLGNAATTSGPSELIPAGAWYYSEPTGASRLGVQIIGATTGQTFTARWW